MQQAHGKSFNLQHITVKVPNKRLPVARATTVPPNSTSGAPGTIPIDQTDSLLNDSDHSPSFSPTPPTPIETSLDFFPPSSPLRVNRDMFTKFNDQGNDSHEEVSLNDSCGDSSSSSSRQLTSADPVSNGRGHNRNNSVDEVLLKMRSEGLTFQPANEIDQRPSTLSRLHKGRLDKPRGGFLSVLAPVRVSHDHHMICVLCHVMALAVQTVVIDVMISGAVIVGNERCSVVHI